MKAKAAYIIAALAAIALTVAVCDGLRIFDRYSKLQGEYETYKHIAQANAEIQAGIIKAQETTIADQDQKLAASEQAVAGLQGHIGNQDANLAVLARTLSSAKTDAERVPILQAQVVAWTEKFNLAQGVIAEKDLQLVAWSAKFDAQVAISAAWKSRYEDEARLHQISRSQLSSLTARLRTSRISGNIKTGLVLLAGGYLAYRGIRGGA